MFGASWAIRTCTIVITVHSKVAHLDGGEESKGRGNGERIWDQSGFFIQFVIQKLFVLQKSFSFYTDYRKTSSIGRTKSPNLNVSCLGLRLSLPNPLKPGVKLRTKM